MVGESEIQRHRNLLDRAIDFLDKRRNVGDFPLDERAFGTGDTVFFGGGYCTYADLFPALGGLRPISGKRGPKIW